MKRHSLPLLLVLSALLAPAISMQANIEYPEARKGDVVEDYHGTEIADPYRWLEDTDSEETQAWIAAQNAVTEAHLGSIEGRDWIRQRLEKLWNYPKYGTPFRVGDRYVFSKNDGLQNQSVYYIADTPDGGNAEVLLDPNKLSEDGTVALNTFSFSEDGKLLAYGTSASGSDWRTFRIRNVKTGEDLADELEWIKFSGASWTKDGKGFFYSRYEAPPPGETYEQANTFMKLAYHEIGESQSSDETIFENPDNPKENFYSDVSDDGRYLLISVHEGAASTNKLYYKDLSDKKAEVVKLIDQADARYDFVGNIDGTFYVLTDLDAPLWRLVAIDLEKPERGNWRDVIPETEDKLDSVRLIGGHWVARYLLSVEKGLCSGLSIFELDGAKQKDIELPTLGTVGGVSGQPDKYEMFYTFSSFTHPPSTYRYDFTTGEAELVRTAEIDFDPEAYTTKQVRYESKDGTMVPMFIVHKKGIAMDGSNPCYLYGYGGFNISLKPSFSVSNLLWYEMGGIFAMPNLRGGGELGEEWHKAGMLENKQNVFDDFIAAAEYLIDEGYTSTPKLAIGGGSNGGLLTAACMTQRPDLYGAVLTAVGVLDMLRFHKFTIGWAWVSEYGSADEAEQFPFLLAYSPLHNLKDGTEYPPTLVTTGDHDDRVAPGHSFKYAARLQEAHDEDSENPVLIRIETKAGHGAGKPTSMVLDSLADRWAFFARHLDIAVPPEN